MQTFGAGCNPLPAVERLLRETTKPATRFASYITQLHFAGESQVYPVPVDLVKSQSRQL